MAARALRPPLMGRHLRRRELGRRELIADVVLALAVAAASSVVTARWLDAASSEDTPVDPLAVAVVGAAGLALAGRRSWPVAVLGLVTAAITGYLLAGYPYGPVFVSFLVAVYTVARHQPLATSAPASALALVAILSHVLTHGAALPGLLALIPGSAWVVVPFAVGTTLRIASEAEGAARADALRQRLDDERLRIAEEVHDVLGHGLAAIQMQADIALYVNDRQPGQAKVALEAISRTSAEAFEELRSTLHVIRRWGEPPLEPVTPSLDRLGELCRRIRQAGVAVELSVDRRRLGLPPAIDAAAYRVVQEALTNVIRHGAVPAATVRVTYGDGAVDLTIANPGPVPGSPDGGLGIPGMRRRVEGLDGTFSAGPAGDGFEVRARLPVGDPG